MTEGSGSPQFTLDASTAAWAAVLLHAVAKHWDARFWEFTHRATDVEDAAELGSEGNLAILISAALPFFATAEWNWPTTLLLAQVLYAAYELGRGAELPPEEVLASSAAELAAAWAEHGVSN